MGGRRGRADERSAVVGNLELVLVDHHPVGIFAFDQHQADFRRRHRDAKHDAHHRLTSPE